MTAPTVSVCMITYNQEQFIDQAVESVLMQETDFPVEIVIGEDCSTDGTRAIVERLAAQHPDRIRLLLAEKNQGGKRNFMRTFAACRGTYQAILEGDDYWTHPHKLQRQVEALSARPDWAMVFHPARVINDDPSVPPSIWPDHWDKAEATLVDLFNRDFIPTNAVLFRRGLFGELPAWFADVFSGDWLLHILNAAHGNIGFLPEIMSVYRVHRGGIWSSMARGEQLAHLLQMLSAVDHYFHGQYSAPIDECRMNILNAAVVEGEAALRERDAAVEQYHAMLECHQRWTRSIPYRVVREAVRPFQQARAWWAARRSTAATDAAPPASRSDNAKAA
jgi:glycosyltransferase involved in cell wall biosynthesis